MLYFFDNQEKLLGYIDNESSLSVIQTEPLRGVIVLEASVIDGYSELLEASTYVGHVDAVNDDSFQLYRIKSISLGDGNVGAKISAQHVVFDELSSRDIIRKVSFNGLNMSAAFMEILKESRWKLGECNVNKSVNLSAENTNVSNLITTLINKYSIELRYRLKFANNKIIGRFIDVFENRGRNTHKRYAYGHNALSVVKEVDSNNLYTAIIPHGKEIEQSEEDRKAKKEKQKLDITKVAWSKLNGNYVDKKIGEDTLELKELSQIYGFSDGSPRTMFKNYDIDDENELIKTAYEDLVNLARPKVQFSAKIEDLGELDIGDSIVIIRSDLGIYYRTRVIEIKRNLIEYGLSELVLGDNLDLKNPQKSTNRLSKQISDLETQINNINVETNKVKDSLKDTSFLDDLRKQLKDGMYDHDSYNYFLKKGNEYGLPPGFYAFNKPIDQNPTSGIWMNGGKMAIANKRNADGTLNWSTWLNGEGIIADYITAGILQGGKVRWNLEDGTFLIGNSISDYSFYWDGSTLHMKDVDIDLTNNSVVKNMNQNIDKNNEDIKKANDVITQTQTSVQILKDSISSKVSKTEILTDKEIQNALKGRDGADGANGSNFTWNLLLKSNEFVKNSLYKIMEYSIADKPVADETYTLTIWGNLGEGKKYFYAFNSNAYINLIALTEVEDGIYTGQFKWRDTLTYGGQTHTADNSKLLIYVFESNVISESTINKIKLEKGVNNNPVWSPHYSEIKGEKGDKGEQGLRGLQGLQGKDGKDGLKGVPGKDGVNSYTHIAYSNSQDGSKDFSTSNSNREYIGIYVDSNKTDSENYKAYKWSKIKGLDGKDGIAGKNGVGLKSTDISYGLSDSETKEPTRWTKTVPNLIKGKYLWTKTVWSYTDNTSETGYAKTYIAKDGNTGKDGIAGKDGVGIKSTTIAYAKSKSGTNPPTSGWISNVPGTNPGDFLWTKTVWNYTDNTSETGYSVSKIGKDGTQGIPGKAGADGKTPYLHIAYSNSIDGSKDFSVNDSNRDYIGQYTDFSKADSTDYKKYSWSKIKGEFEGEIGARNLIKNSDDLSNCFYKFDGGKHDIVDVDMPEFRFSGKKVQSLAGNQTDGTKEIMRLDSENLIDGKTYTFSMYVKNNRDVPMRFNIKSIECDFIELKPNEIKRLVVTGKKIEDTYANGKFRVFFNANTKDYYIDCTVSRPQLEEGDVATSWKPNPLDLISETQTVKRTFEAYKEQTDRRLLSTVSQTDFNKNNVAIKKQFSSVDQKANGIISTVSSNYKNLSKKIDGKPSTTTVQSLISQKVDSVKIEVSDQISGVNSSISVMQDNIKLKADKTDLYGLVSFSDLEDSNSWTVINGENIKTGKISSADGSSWINLKDGNFSFYHNSLFIDENEYDWNSRTKRTRLHTLGTFRVSYGKNPSVELNSGGITLFNDKEDQDSKGTNKIQSNGDGNVQIGSIDDNGNTTIYAEIGKKEGYVMHIYGSLFVHRNLRVKDAIRYGASCQQGTTF
uniref:Tail protein n=1 Tax=Firmicutes phage HS19 TaxID=3056397 RepID=A0AA49X4H3_9VIRU|nr:MAG: tail protein [Firmicutes phage HS19]